MPPRRRKQTPNVAALSLTLTKLRDAGRIEEIDAARVQAVISMAEHLDLDAGNAALWRQYWGAVGELTAGDDSSLDDDLADLFSEVGDPPAAGPPDVRR